MKGQGANINEKDVGEENLLDSGHEITREKRG